MPTPNPSLAHPRAHAVLSYWYGDDWAEMPLCHWPSDKGKIWYAGGEAVDQHIRDTFGADLEAVAAGEYDTWLTGSPWDAVAGIVIMDQFSRNAYRGSARSFALDPKALSWARHLAADGSSVAALPFVMRTSLVLVHMHSEALEMQQEGVQLAAGLLQAAKEHGCPEQTLNSLGATLSFGQRHLDIIAKWGRFPHRNQVLGRESTPEEVAGLADGSIGRF